MASVPGRPIRIVSISPSARMRDPMTPQAATGASRRAGRARSMRSGMPALPQGAPMTGRRACATITLPITRHFCVTPTATGSKPSATTRCEVTAMQIGQPSRTALGAAAYRAVHQTLEGGVIFADPFAMQILDDDARAGLPGTAGDPANRPMRLFIAARSRFSEDTMTACVARGVRQIVILGAGLDTFSL